MNFRSNISYNSRDWKTTVVEGRVCVSATGRGVKARANEVVKVLGLNKGVSVTELTDLVNKGKKTLYKVKDITYVVRRLETEGLVLRSKVKGRVKLRLCVRAQEKFDKLEKRFT